MFNKCLLIGITLIITLSFALSQQVSATIVRNNTGSPVNVTVHFKNGGVGQKLIDAGGSIDAAGDITKLEVSPSGTQSSVEPVLCDGILSIDAIEMNVKDGIIKCE